MRFSAISMIVLMAGGAAAQEPVRTADAALVIEQAKPCTNLTMTADTFRVVAEITLANGDPKTIEVLSFTPDTVQGNFTASAITRGIARCGPYAAIDGVISVTISEADFVGEEVDIVIPD